MKIVDEIIKSLEEEPERWRYSSGGGYLERSDGLEIKIYDGPLGYRITEPSNVGLTFQAKFKLWEAIRIWKIERLSLDNLMRKN